MLKAVDVINSANESKKYVHKNITEYKTKLEKWFYSYIKRIEPYIDKQILENKMKREVSLHFDLLDYEIATHSLDHEYINSFVKETFEKAYEGFKVKNIMYCSTFLAVEIEW